MEEKTHKLDLHIVACPSGYYVSDKVSRNSPYDRSDVKKYTYRDDNGEVITPKETFHSLWFFFDRMPATATIETERIASRRFVKINNRVNAPDVLEYDQVQTDEDGDWIGEFEGLRQFYSMEDTYEKIVIPCELVVTIDVELGFDIALPPKITTLEENGFTKRKAATLNRASINRSVIDQIVTPGILQHYMPCSLTSTQVYSIVRAYVKENIDPTAAEIYLDTDDHFTVNKRIAITPYKTTEKYKLPGKRKVHISERFVTHRQAQVFAMAHSKSYHDDITKYGVMQPITADNEFELEEKVRELCEQIIIAINEPVSDCPTCNGRGVIANTCNLPKA